MEPLVVRQQLFTAVTATLQQWIDGFLLAKRAEGLSPGTIKKIYGPRLAHFAAYCQRRGVTAIEAIDPTLLREYLLELAQSHNPGGCHQFYRVVKTFLLWFEVEGAADGWRNPIKRVPPPKVPDEILEPVDTGDVLRMVQACGTDTLGLRDKAMLLTLLDTGLRASEMLGLDLADFDIATGSLTVRRGKGGKGRIVFMGQTGRRALRAWLRVRGGQPGPLFLNRRRQRLAYLGLRTVLLHRAQQAGVPVPSAHDFRRAFAINMLRNGADLLSLQRLMGHADLSVLHRYAKQSVDDLRAAHGQASPVDRLMR